MLATIPRNHPHQRRKRGADDSVDDRETPPDVFDPLNREFRFTLDAAAARHNAKCARYYSLPPQPLGDARQLRLFDELFVGDPEAVALDGLSQEWGRGERIWCNPPFSNIEPWVAKAHSCKATVVMLLPANRTEQPFWQNWIEGWRDGQCHWNPANSLWECPFDSCQTRFLAGRRAFRNRGAEIKNRTSRNPPFGIVIVIWDRRNHE